jgi:hypothetical protein
MPSCGRGDAVKLRELSLTLVASIPPAKIIELRKLLPVRRGAQTPSTQ